MSQLFEKSLKRVDEFEIELHDSTIFNLPVLQRILGGASPEAAKKWVEENDVPCLKRRNTWVFSGRLTREALEKKLIGKIDDS